MHTFKFHLTEAMLLRAYDAIQQQRRHEPSETRASKMYGLEISLDLPAALRLENAPAGATISGMLAEGSIDAVIGPRAPSCFERGHPHVGWLYPDSVAAAIPIAALVLLPFLLHR